MTSRVVSTIIGLEQKTLSISNEGNVLIFGSNLTEESEEIYPPRIIPSLMNIKAICCGTNHTLCLNVSGEVFTFGGNSFGELGVGKSKLSLRYTSEPQKVDLPPIKQVSCGVNSSFCLSEDGILYSFGYNKYGQLGHGTEDEKISPKKIESLEDIEFIESGGEYTFCKTICGDCYGWGFNLFGQLGLGTANHKNRPTNCSGFWPDEVVDIKCGTYHTLVLVSSGDVYSCGNDFSGQLGLYPEQKTLTLRKVKNLPTFSSCS